LSKITRRRFVEGTGAGLLANATPLEAQEAHQARAGGGVPRTAIQVTVNGASCRIEAEDRWTLAEVLRDHFGLTGTKIGCDRGDACTVLLNGKPVYCSQWAVWADGRSLQTVEGLAANGKLHPLQEAFIAHDGPQCGFTSGTLISAEALLGRSPHPTAEDVRAMLTGNLRRCSNYNHCVEAVLAAAGHASARARRKT
jgi:aerobic-type carbon monoxide dehydrogenase small subunit (CoxS/CutS family)